jgi:hypothetical protein
LEGVDLTNLGPDKSAATEKKLENQSRRSFKDLFTEER